jgi:hypothetical protein
MSTRLGDQLGDDGCERWWTLTNFAGRTLRVGVDVGAGRGTVLVAGGQGVDLGNIAKSQAVSRPSGRLQAGKPVRTAAGRRATVWTTDGGRCCTDHDARPGAYVRISLPTR